MKALESAGAQVVPIKYDWDEEKLLEVFEGLNGLLFPGGGTELIKTTGGITEFTDYALAAKNIMKIARDINDRGVYFPVWGTCLGYELMILAASDDLDVLDKGFSSLNYSNSIQFLEVGAYIFRKERDHVFFLGK